MERYSSVCQIGKGACGAVFLVRNKKNRKLYALKKIELDESRKTRTKDAVQREANIMAEMKHPHIVTYHESFFEPNEKHLCIILDYCDGGTLEDRTREAQMKNTFLPEKTIIQWFLQIAMAVRYMHSKKVLHRDLKTPNVFLNKSGTLCKLGDFGIAKTMDKTIEVASTCVGTPCYLSPEMCQDIPYTSKADVWALGCMLYEMCALKPAFDANNLVSLFYKIVKAEFEPIPDEYSPEMKNLVSYVLTKTPDERPSARGVLAMPFLRKELLTFIEEKEFILQQRRVPTRQGSRPYSTPTLSRTYCDSEKCGSQDEVMASNAKRATSCRPLLSTSTTATDITSTSTENTITAPISRESSIPPKSSRSGRVSTIPEETEEQLLERSLRLNASLNFSQGGNGLRIQLDLLREDDEQKARDISSDSCKTGAESKGADPFIPTRLTKLENKDIANVLQEVIPSEKVQKVKEDNKTRSTSVTPRMVKGSKTQEEKIMHTPEKKKKPRRKSADSVPPKSKENVELVPIPTSNKKREQLSSPEPKTPRLPQIDKKEMDKNNQTKLKSDLSRKSKIQEPLRTPRLVEPNALQVQDNRNIGQPDIGRVSTKKKYSSRGKRGKDNREYVKSSMSRASSKIASRECTELYYSDDFDDDSSTSEIEEDIPDYVSDMASQHGRSHSVAHASDILDIPEDLPDGLEGVDEDSETAGEDIAEEIEEEELDMVVNVAREAHQELNKLISEDEVIIDNSTRNNSASVLIRRHCKDVLGEEQFEKISSYVNEHNMGRKELKKLATILGGENMQTIYLMNEVLSRSPRKK